MNRQFKGVIFDVDGVLVDSEPLHQRAWKQILEEFGITLSDAQFHRLMGKTTHQILAMYFEQYGIREDLEFWSFKKDEVYRSLVHEELKPLDGVVSLLEFLRSRKVRMGVASSAVRQNVKAALDCLGPDICFDSILSVEDITHPKPNPEIYLKAAQALELPPSDCGVIEDSLPGIQSAKEAGAFVIGITTNVHPLALTVADLVCSSFHEIRLFLEPRLGP
jgi:HAD superfamily hydrolase (TIGR01509 family)